MTLKVLLLPGLDGSGFYFEQLRTNLSRDYPCELLAYPAHLYDYESLCEWMESKLDLEAEYIIIAESFGGPLGILIAEMLENQAKALVLCATFCQPPLPRWILWLAAALYPHFIHFDWMAHFINFFLCNGKNLAIAKALHRKLLQSSDKAIASRIRILRNIDLRPESSVLPLPCLVLKATHDRLVWFSRFTHMTHAQVLDIEGPHGLMGTRYPAVAEAISAFIKAKL